MVMNIKMMFTNKEIKTCYWNLIRNQICQNTFVHTMKIEKANYNISMM